MSESQSHLGLALLLDSRPSLETVLTLSQKVFALFNIVELNSDMQPPPSPLPDSAAALIPTANLSAKDRRGAFALTLTLALSPCRPASGGQSWLPKWATLVYVGA